MIAGATQPLYTAVLNNVTDYYAFGAPMPGRQYSSTSYRYGFNGKENDKETVSTGSGTQDYGMRIYNPSLGRFLSMDPIAKDFAWNSPYSFAENDVSRSIDLEGKEKYIVVKITDDAGKVVAMRIIKNIANRKLVDQFVSQKGPSGKPQPIQDASGNQYKNQNVVEINYNSKGVATVSFKEKLSERETEAEQGKVKVTPTERNFIKTVPLTEAKGYRGSEYSEGYVISGSSKISSNYSHNTTTYADNGGTQVNAIYIDESSKIFDSKDPNVMDVLKYNFQKVQKK